MSYRNLVFSASITLFIMMFFPNVSKAGPYYDEALFVTDSGLEIVEDFEAYEIQYPHIPLGPVETFADGAVVVEAMAGSGNLGIVFEGQIASP